MAHKDRFAALLDEPDQARVESDLTTFFGHNSQRYLSMYRITLAKQRASGHRSMNKTWNFPALLFGLSWFFYRKMFVMGFIVLLLPVTLKFLFGSELGASGNIVLIVTAGRYADSLYLDKAARRLAKADRLGLTGLERGDYLRHAGGVSVAGGVLGATVLILSVAVVLTHHHAHR